MDYSKTTGAVQEWNEKIQPLLSKFVYFVFKNKTEYDSAYKRVFKDKIDKFGQTGQN